MGLEYAFRLAEEYLLRNFLAEVDVQNQDLQILTTLLKNDMLHVRYEEQVWEAIEKWVKKDENARKVHFDQLLKCLRVGLVSESFLQKKASEMFLRSKFYTDFFKFKTCPLYKNIGYKRGKINNLIELQIMNSDLIASSPKAKIYIQLAKKTVLEWSKRALTNEEDEPPYEAKQRIPHQTLVVVGGFQAESQENAAPVNHLEFYNINSNCWTVVCYAAFALCKN
jgi:hypothetical protein